MKVKDLIHGKQTAVGNNLFAMIVIVAVEGDLKSFFDK